MEYILEQTIQKHDVVDEPYPKVLDMCCGCGNFLISAYEILHKKFLENIDNLRVKYGRGFISAEDISLHIIKNCIFAVDTDEDYGDGSPCESASNKPLQADSAVLASGEEVLLDLQQANYLNDNGVITAINFYNGFVSWGNYTAAFPQSSDPVDYFYCISRMFKWVAKTVTLTYWNSLDRRMTRRLIDAILQGVNDWLNGLTTEEKILGGRVEFREDENSLTALMAGKAKFHIYLTPPSPLQEMEFTLEYDVSYLSAALEA